MTKESSVFNVYLTLIKPDILGYSQHFKYDANGHTTKIEYDPMNRQTAVIDANGRRTDMQYDLAGRLIATKDSNGHTRRNQYDALGRLIQTSSEQGRSSQIQYDANGNPTHSLDANTIANPQHPKNNQNASVYREYDALNRLTLERDADNGDTTYSYDLLGNITQITDAEGQTTQFEYDLYNGVRVITDPVIETPNDATTIIRRNEAGLPLIIRGRDGRRGIYSYDDYNRLKKVSHSFYNFETLQTETIEENYQYDAYGDLIQVSNDAVSYSYDYTRRHELKSKTDSRLNKSLSWTYDPIGNIDTKTDYQGHVTNYQYDSTGRLTALQNQQFLQVSYHYDGAGRLIDRILSNGAKTRYQYDDDNRLIQLINSSANGTEVENLNYQQDEVGNITQISNSTTGKVTDYQYDALYRLINVDSSDNTEDRTYSYDKVGNRKTESKNGITYYYCYHPTDCTQPPQGNRLYSIKTGSPTGSIYRQFFYDNAGRINAKTNEQGQLIYGINYNAKGRAKSIFTPNGSQQFEYDPNDYRIKKDNQLYHLEGEHLEATYSDTSELKNSYFRGVIVDEIVSGYSYHSQAPGDWTNYTFHHDHLNSVTALTGHAGSIEETTRYDAFGEILNPASLNSGNELLYTGRQLDRETGLVYYRARYYDTEIDRFITEDPLGFEAGVNFYAYVGNNPVNFNDPTGLVRWGDLGNASLGLLSGGSGIVVGGATVVGGTGLIVAPEPATTAAGIGAVAFGSTLFTNSAANIALNGRRFVDALVDAPPSVPSNFAEVIAGKIAPSNTNAILLANAANLGLDLASGKVPVGLIPDLASSGSALQSTRLANFSGLADYNAASRTIGNLPVELAVPGASAVTQAIDALQFFATAQTVSGIGGLVAENFSNVAGGGFVLYPSKPNTNALQSVYSK